MKQTLSATPASIICEIQTLNCDATKRHIIIKCSSQ